MNKIKNFFKRIIGMRRRNKVILGILILVILFFVFKGRGKPVVIAYQTVAHNNIQSQVNASGILSGKNVAQLHFNLSGKLNYLGVTNGDKVSKGQIIAALDGTAFNSALQQALNNRRNTQANVDYVHDQVKDHSGDETFAQKASRTAAESANDSAYDAVLAAQKSLRDATLTSPIAGVVVAQGNLNMGQNVSVTDNIATIVDFSQKDFDATVDESDIGSIQIGQDVQITLNAYGDAIFNGRVVEIESQTQTDTTGSITVTVKIAVDDPRIATIYGLNGQANIITQAKQNVLTISQDALIDDTHVYVKDGSGKPVKREIVTGIKSDTEVEIISGLNEGDQVVTNPQAVPSK